MSLIIKPSSDNDNQSVNCHFYLLIFFEIKKQMTNNLIVKQKMINIATLNGRKMKWIFKLFK